MTITLTYEATFADYRRAAGFKTQEELSNVLKIARPTIAKWETGDRMPHGRMLRKIAPVLGITEGDIIKAIMAAKGGDEAD